MGWLWVVSFLLFFSSSSSTSSITPRRRILYFVMISPFFSTPFHFPSSRHRWTPEYFHGRRRDRLEYTLLWKRKRVGHEVFEEDDDPNGIYRPLSKYDIGRLERLEYQLSTEDIIFFRSLSERDLRKTRSTRIVLLEKELKRKAQTER